MEKIEIYFKNLVHKMLDPVAQKRIMGIVIYIALGVVALVMTIINLLTMNIILLIGTGGFTVACIVNLLLSISGRKGVDIAAVCLCAEVILLFVFFIISGKPEAFSMIWICLLPSMGLLFYGRARGSILCLIMEIILVFFLWTSIGRSCLLYDYTESFSIRFPIVFLAFYLIALLLESIRLATFNELIRLQEQYKDLARRDTVTGLLNRQGLFENLYEQIKKNPYCTMTAIMFDLDKFKRINDTYGHKAGDNVLEQFAKLLNSNLNAINCRWGGEEFLAVAFGTDVSNTDIEALRKLVEEYDFISDDKVIKLTVSVGVAVERECEDYRHIDHFIQKADYALYDAKKNGRNRIVYF